MKYYAYILLYKKRELDDTYVMRFEPIQKGFRYSFIPGQYAYIVNPNCSKPKEPHPFSIASTPNNFEYLEFCIKRFGQWTNTLLKKRIGEIVFISESEGNFILDEGIRKVTFLVGGIGIAPVMSILRTIALEKDRVQVTILYGNRTPSTIAYKSQLKRMSKKIDLKVVNVYSEFEGHLSNSYRGFITPSIIENESDTNSSFFIIGPPIFIEKMKKELFTAGIKRVKYESLTERRSVFYPIPRILR